MHPNNVQTGDLSMVLDTGQSRLTERILKCYRFSDLFTEKRLNEAKIVCVIVLLRFTTVDLLSKRINFYKTLDRPIISKLVHYLPEALLEINFKYWEMVQCVSMSTSTLLR